MLCCYIAIIIIEWCVAGVAVAGVAVAGVAVAHNIFIFISGWCLLLLHTYCIQLFSCVSFLSCIDNSSTWSCKACRNVALKEKRLKNIVSSKKKSVVKIIFQLRTVISLSCNHTFSFVLWPPYLTIFRGNSI